MSARAAGTALGIGFTLLILYGIYLQMQIWQAF